MNIELLVREHLNKTFHMSLGTSRDNKPWVCEVHFAYDDDLNIYYRSLTSRRHSQEIADNPSVAGNIVRQFSLEEAPIGVYFEGMAKLLPAGDEQTQAFRAISKRQNADESILTEASDPDKHQFYKITVANFYIFGKFDGESSKKYELKWNGGAK